MELTKKYFITLGLVSGMVFGLGVGSIFVWSGLIELMGFGYFIGGFLMVILGMFSTVLLFAESEVKSNSS